MKTTKKIVSVILTMCMLVSTAVVSSFAAKKGEISPVSSDYARDNSYTKAAENIDAEYAYTVDDLGITYTKDATTFKVWSPTATDVKVNIYETGSDDEKVHIKLEHIHLKKCWLMVSGMVCGQLHLLVNGKICTTHTQSQPLIQHTWVLM